MSIPGPPRAMALEDRVESLGIVSQILDGHGGVLNEGDRFAVALHRHHDVEARLAHFGDLRLEIRLDGATHAVRKAQIAHKALKPCELRKQRLILEPMKFDDQEA